jgi:hypothetical protein
MIYFVTEQYLKQNTNVGANVDAAITTPSITVAADTYVRSIIGTPFYNYLLTEFNNQTLDADEVTLVQDYIKNAVAWRAASEIVVAASYQLKNKGIQTQSGDYSASPEYKALMFNVHHAADKASFYDNRLSEYLGSDKNKYPQFWAYDNRFAIARRHCETPNLFNQNIMFI